MGTVEEYGFQPIEKTSTDTEIVKPFVDPDMLLGRTINNVMGGRHARNHIENYDKFVFVSQSQVSINPAKHSQEVIVYVHDLFPSTTVYNSTISRNSLIRTVGDLLLRFTNMRSSRYINNADKVVAPCQTMAEELERRTALENVKHAYQGVDHLPESNYTRPRDIDLLYFGDLVHERKNPEKVYQVFEEANRKGYTTAYMNHTDDERIEADHKFIDVDVDELVNVLSRSRFLFQPSYAEGLGRTPLEAQRYGCIPIVMEGTQYFDVAQEVLGLKNQYEWRSFQEDNEVWNILEENIEDRQFSNPEKYTWNRFQKKMEKIIHE